MELKFRTPGFPAEEKDISNLETRLGYVFPPDYRAFLLRVNGGYQPNLEVFDIGNGEGTMLKDLYSLGGEGIHDLARHIEFLADDFPSGVIPVGQDGFGNDICLGISNDNYGEVYFHYHDRGKADPDDEFEPAYFVAHSFQEFLKSLRMDPGKISHDEIELMGKNGGRAELINFISKGNSLEKPNKYKRTVAQEAARHGNLKLLQVCREHGAALNGALRIAAMNGHLAVVAYLCEQGVDINERDNEGKTPLSWAKRHAEIVDFLEKRGAV